MLDVVDRGWVSSITPITVYADVTDGQLRYGIYNIAAGGNWYVANVTSIVYVSTSQNAPARHGISNFDDPEAEEGTTEIDALPQEPQGQADVIYDMMGRKVTKPGRGLHIVNGKKVWFNK
jgi:hypothetical protein